MAGAKPYSEAQAIAMINSVALRYYAGDPVRNRALFALDLACGLRVSELVRIRLGDLIDDFGQIRADLRVYQLKTDCFRVVPIAHPLFFVYVVPYLRLLRNRGVMLKDDFVFSGRSGGHICERTVNRIYGAGHDELRLSGFSSHSPRKTWAIQVYTQIVAANRTGKISVDPFEKLCDIGGWKSYDAARRYIADAVDCRREIQQAIYPELSRALKKVSKS